MRWRESQCWFGYSIRSTGNNFIFLETTVNLIGGDRLLERTSGVERNMAAFPASPREKRRISNRRRLRRFTSLQNSVELVGEGYFCAGTETVESSGTGLRDWGFNRVG